MKGKIYCFVFRVFTNKFMIPKFFIFVSYAVNNLASLDSSVLDIGGVYTGNNKFK